MATVSSSFPVRGGSNNNNPTTAAAKPKSNAAVTPQPRTKKNNNGNSKNGSFSVLDRRMAVDKNVIDELLLVCGVIGTNTETLANGVEALVPVTDCLNWLQDLQRALRRDEDLYRPISLLLGKWNVVQHKLLPLVMTCRYDTPMVLTIVKILVILTKPLHENTMRAGRLVIDTKSKKVSPEVIREQKKLRENAIVQSNMLMEYKRAIVHHASHRRSSKNNNSAGNDNGGVLSIFVSLLAEPLSKTGTKRTDADHLTIELVLHLFRNILSAEPILKGSPEASLKCAQLHNECIALFEKELVLEILLVICQEMELRENAQYNLLMMELLHHLFKSQDPTGVARCMLTDKPVDMMAKENNNTTTTTAKAAKAISGKSQNGGKGGKASLQRSSTKQQGSSSSSGGGFLRAQMMRDKQKFRTGAPARHGNFGGTLMLKRPDGKQQYVSASVMMDRGGQSTDLTNSTGGPKRKKNRKTEPFVGSGRTLLSHTRAGHTQNANRGPPAIRAQKTLHRFCQVFLNKCYGPVMKSLKNEFRRDSVRLEGDDDKVVFFRIVWFFFQWFRVSGFGKTLENRTGGDEGETKDSTNGSGLGQLIFTMDVFTFNLVLTACTTFITHKKYTQLSQTVGLYAEMMHMLYDMFSSKDSTEQIMALGLMDRLFYGSEPVDRLPKLLSSWTPAATTREYVCDLVEVVHVTLKLLDANNKSCADIMESQEAQQAMVNKKGGKKKKIQTNDAVLQMKLAASDFDVQSYFLRKVVSNGAVFMYTKLLDQYDSNAKHVNHRIVSLFLRLAKVKIVNGDEEPKPMHWAPEGAEPLRNLLAPKTTTLEPMLYNIQLIMVVNRILNDPLIRNDKAYATTLSWAAGLVHNFATLASNVNPVLYIETLFKHPVPHRFCELSTNLYVNEELRMIAERELLLEARRLEILNGDNSEDEDDMEEDDELEFVDIEAGATKKRSADAGSDDSDNDGENDKARGSNAAIKKRRLQLKKRDMTQDADSSDDEELQFEVTSTSTLSGTNESVKSSPPKNPFDEDSSDEEEFDTPTTETAATTKATSLKPAFDESSDEEEGTPITKKEPEKAAPAPNNNLDDNSSDEETESNNGSSGDIRSKALDDEREKLSKAVLENSDDDDEDEADKEELSPSDFTADDIRDQD